MKSQEKTTLRMSFTDIRYSGPNTRSRYKGPHFIRRRSRVSLDGTRYEVRSLMTFYVIKQEVKLSLQDHKGSSDLWVCKITSPSEDLEVF